MELGVKEIVPWVHDVLGPLIQTAYISRGCLLYDHTSERDTTGYVKKGSLEHNRLRMD